MSSFPHSRARRSSSSRLLLPVAAIVALGVGSSMATAQESVDAVVLEPCREPCGLTLVPEREYGADSGEGMIEAEMAIGRLDASGRAYVIAGWSTPHVWVFGADGSLLSRIGRFGSGPGEFGDIGSIVVTRRRRVFRAGPRPGGDHDLRLDRRAVAGCSNGELVAAGYPDGAVGGVAGASCGRHSDARTSGVSRPRGGPRERRDPRVVRVFDGGVRTGYPVAPAYDRPWSGPLRMDGPCVGFLPSRAVGVEHACARIAARRGVVSARPDGGPRLGGQAGSRSG